MATLEDLTKRQRQAFCLSLRGYTGDEIAAAMGCELKTVRAHVGSARRKLGVPTKRSAIEWAERAGLVAFNLPEVAP